MALKFTANTSPAAGSTTTNQYSRVPLGNFAVTTNQVTLSAFVNIEDWGPSTNDIRVIVKQNINTPSVTQPVLFRSAQVAGTSASNVNTLTILKPVGLAVGDLLIVGLYITTNNPGLYGTVAYPAGFQQAITVQGYGSHFNKLFVAYKIATPEDVAATNYTFTHTPSSGTTTYRIAGILSAYSNVDQLKPLDDVAPTEYRTIDDPNASSFSIFAPSITPKNSDPKRILCFYGVGGGQGLTDGYNVIPPTNQTERGEISGGAIGYGKLMLADEAYTSTSPTGIRTATITNANSSDFSAKGSYSASVVLRAASINNTSAPNYQWYLGLNRADTAASPKTVAARFNYTNDTLLGTTPLQTNTWYHIAAVYNNGVGRVYLNGNLEGTLSTFNPGTFANDTHPVMLGNNAPDASNILVPNSAGGSITQPAIWNAALTENEIKSLAAGVTPYKIRASSLVSFVPQLGFNDIDVIRGVTLTKVNASTVPDPRMFVGSTKPSKLKKYPVFSGNLTAPTLVVTPTSSSTISVVVTAAPPSGTSITSYVVQRALTSTGWENETTGTNSSNFEDSGLSPNTTYYYRAKYVLADGRSSPWSTTKQATTSEIIGGADPLAPILTAISSSAEDSPAPQ